MGSSTKFSAQAQALSEVLQHFPTTCKFRLSIKSSISKCSKCHHTSTFKNKAVTELFVECHFENNLTVEHDILKLVMWFHSESTAHSNDIDNSYSEKIPKIGKNSLIIDLMFHQIFANFVMCSKHYTIHISRLTILSWTERTNNFAVACTAVEIFLYN